MSGRALLVTGRDSTMEERLSIQGLLQELEFALLQPEIRKSDRLAELLADDFLEFGSSGRVFTKAQIIAALEAEHPIRITASEFKIKLLAPHVALVTYQAVCHSDPVVLSLRSSIWEHKQGRWQIVFHQGTTAPTQ